MEEEKKTLIKDLIVGLKNSGKDKYEICDELMLSFIFGPNSYNEHYNIDEFIEIYNETEQE